MPDATEWLNDNTERVKNGLRRVLLAQDARSLATHRVDVDAAYAVLQVLTGSLHGAAWREAIARHVEEGGQP